eukprot:3143482-Amphidinium_carterae.1
MERHLGRLLWTTACKQSSGGGCWSLGRLCLPSGCSSACANSALSLSSCLTVSRDSHNREVSSITLYETLVSVNNSLRIAVCASALTVIVQWVLKCGCLKLTHEATHTQLAKLSTGLTAEFQTRSMGTLEVQLCNPITHAMPCCNENAALNFVFKTLLQMLHASSRGAVLGKMRRNLVMSDWCEVQISTVQVHLASTPTMFRASEHRLFIPGTEPLYAPQSNTTTE